MNRPLLPLFAAALLGLATIASAAPKKKPAPASDDAEAAAPAVDELKGVDKKRFESYLKERLSKINEHHKERMDFLAKEADTWNSFWTKVRDERKLFEIRQTRQTLDLFESLASLDPRDHGTTISDFEKMQANVVRSFDMGQKQKMAEFFAARDARWKEFIAGQEQERAEFLAEAASDWQRSKAAIKNPGMSASAEAPADEASDEEEAAPKKKAKPAKTAQRERKPAKSNGGGAFDDDRWH